MYIHTKIGENKVSVVCWGYEDSRIELTIYVDDQGHTIWHGISLDPQQALKVAHRLQNPLPDVWVDFVDPAPAPAPQGEMRSQWDVFKVKHSNGVHEGAIGILKGKIGINTSSFNIPKKSCRTDYFYCAKEENLSPAEIKKLAGLLYHWAGARMIGLVTERKKLVRKVLPLVDKQNLETEEHYADHWRDDDSPQAEKTFGVCRQHL